MRYKVRLNINGPVILSTLGHMTPGDSILAYAFVSGSNPTNVQEAINNLPLVKEKIGEDFFYRISSPRLIGSQIMKEINIVKSTSYGRIAGMNPSLLESMNPVLEKNNTPWKRCSITLTPMWCEAAEFIFESNEVDRVMELFSNLVYFGKKSALGYGRIKSIEGPFETDEPITRPLPVDHFKVTGPVFPQRLKPAYFCAEGRHVAGTGEI